MTLMQNIYSNPATLTKKQKDQVAISYWYDKGVSFGSRAKNVYAFLVGFMETHPEGNFWFLGRDMEPFYLVARKDGFTRVKYLAGLNRDCSMKMMKSEAASVEPYLIKIGFNFQRDYLVDTGFFGTIFTRVVQSIRQTRFGYTPNLLGGMESEEASKALEKRKKFSERCVLLSGENGTQFTLLTSSRITRSLILEIEEAPKREYVRYDAKANQPWVRKHPDQRKANSFLDGFQKGISEPEMPTKGSCPYSF